MFKPEMNPLAPKPIGPKKPEKELVEIWLGKEAAAEMDEREPEMGDEDLNPTKHELTVKEKKALWEMRRPDEVTLKNIPKWEELPDEETFKKDFNFQDIWLGDWLGGRPLSAFTPRPEETLSSFQATEALPHAKVFNITDAIAKAQEKDPKHPPRLTTAEVLKAIDAAGYRPATLEELLAYARDYWKPDANPDLLTKAEPELRNARAPYIACLGSVFSDSDGDRNVPYLYWDGAGRELNSGVLENDWFRVQRFLVLRKAFSP